MKKLSVALLFVGIASFSFGQKIVKVSGDLKFLKGQDKINLVYDYSEMALSFTGQCIFPVPGMFCRSHFGDARAGSHLPSDVDEIWYRPHSFRHNYGREH